MRGAVMFAIAGCVVSACSFAGQDVAGDGEPMTPVEVPDAAPPEQGTCAPLPEVTNAVTVATLAELRAALAVAGPSTTILLADGSYGFTGATLVLGVPGLTLRSASNRADAVTFVAAAQYLPFKITASDVTLASFTITGSQGTAIEITAGATTIERVRIHDLTLIDQPGAAISIIGTAAGPYADAGQVTCSRIEHRALSNCGDVTLGIKASAARGWVVRGNEFKRLACNSQPGWSVSFDGGSRDTSIVNNVFVGNAANIRLGSSGVAGRTYTDPAPAVCGGGGVPDHRGGLVCNNAISGVGAPVRGGTFDFLQGIALYNACDAWVMHNTIVADPAETEHTIHVRDALSYVHLVNNLVKAAPFVETMGEIDSLYAASNMMWDLLTQFTDPALGDLRPASGAVLPSGVALGAIDMCRNDARGAQRTGAAPAAGAFEP